MEKQMLSFAYTDTRGLVPEEALVSRCKKAAPLLAKALAGDEKYADSTGWCHVEENAGQEHSFNAINCRSSF